MVTNSPGSLSFILALFAVLSFGSKVFGADTKTVVDSAGRQIKVPAKIERIFAAGAPAGVFIYTLAPEKLIDWHPGDGWEPICDKLGLPVPSDPFPHVNTTDDFRAMVGMEPLT